MDCYSIRWHELKADLLGMLGSGSFGHVYNGMYHHDEVAIKVMTIDRDEDFDEKAVEMFK